MDFYPSLGALILAAGKGTRMPSRKHKVLQTLLGESMLAYVYHALVPLADSKIFTLIGHQGLGVSEALKRITAPYGHPPRIVEQKELLGTGHCLQVSYSALAAAGLSHVLVVNGDAPLLTTETLQVLLEQAKGHDMAFLSLLLDNAGSYGRVLRGTSGAVTGIIEAKDDTRILPPGEPVEVNAGVYLFSLPLLEKVLPMLQNNNAKKEYYLTDCVAHARAHGFSVHAHPIEDEAKTSLLGVNTAEELIDAEKILQQRQIHKLLRAGVILHNQATLVVSPFANLEAGVELFGPMEITGATHISFGAEVHGPAFIHASTIAENVVIQPFCHIENATIAAHAIVGPYARLRSGAVIGESAKVGNFVEVKNTTLGEGSKASHLSYLGDAQIGSNVNIGAGTITCNYDGKRKHKTVIEDNVFIGSNTALVAPVTIGEGSLVGAGSVITHDVPPENLAIARGQQYMREKKQ